MLPLKPPHNDSGLDMEGDPSVMSPRRYGMSGRAAKVKPGPEPPPQDPGGRF